MLEVGAESFSHAASFVADMQPMFLAATTALGEEVVHRAKSQEAGIRAGSPIEVLLVEDDADAAALAQVHLAGDPGAAFRVEWTPGIVEAMIRLADPGIDVILLDLGLHEFTGIMSYRAIEIAARRRLPVVVFTSDDSVTSRELTLALGATDYLLKHETSPLRLRQALHSAIRRGRPGRGGTEPRVC